MSGGCVKWSPGAATGGGGCPATGAQDKGPRGGGSSKGKAGGGAVSLLGLPGGPCWAWRQAVGPELHAVVAWDETGAAACLQLAAPPPAGLRRPGSFGACSGTPRAPPALEPQTGPAAQ
eukprot:scaffold69548_cov18-Tisochrysis_lutea.AAC.2